MQRPIATALALAGALAAAGGGALLAGRRTESRIEATPTLTVGEAVALARAGGSGGAARRLHGRLAGDGLQPMLGGDEQVLRGRIDIGARGEPRARAGGASGPRGAAPEGPEAPAPALVEEQRGALGSWETVARVVRLEDDEGRALRVAFSPLRLPLRRLPSGRARVVGGEDGGPPERVVVGDRSYPLDPARWAHLDVTIEEHIFALLPGEEVTVLAAVEEVRGAPALVDPAGGSAEVYFGRLAEPARRGRRRLALGLVIGGALALLAGLGWRARLGGGARR